MTDHFCCKEPPPPISNTLSLHDALPISSVTDPAAKPPFASLCTSVLGTLSDVPLAPPAAAVEGRERRLRDRKSTRLNSSHLGISYAVFCLIKKKTSAYRLTPVDSHGPST